MGLQICAYSHKSPIYLSVLRFLLYCLLLICSSFVYAVSAFLSPTPLLCPSHSALSLCSSPATISLSPLHLMMHCQKIQKSCLPARGKCRKVQMQFSKIIAACTVNNIERFFNMLRSSAPCAHVLSI